MLLYLFAKEIHREPQALQLLLEDPEGFGHTRLEHILTLHYGLIGLHSTRHVIRLNRQHLLEVMGSAIGLQRPHLHFTKALPTELGLPAEGLLGYEGIRTCRTGVDFVLHQVNQLHHIDGTNGDRLVEGLSRSAVSEHRLAEEGRNGIVGGNGLPQQLVQIVSFPITQVHP